MIRKPRYQTKYNLCHNRACTLAFTGKTGVFICPRVMCTAKLCLHKTDRQREALKVNVTKALLRLASVYIRANISPHLFKFFLFIPGTVVKGLILGQIHLRRASENLC